MSDFTQKLDLLSVGQAGKELTVNEVLDALSPSALFGRRAQATSGLTWGYYGGRMVVGNVSTNISNGTLALTDAATNYVEVEPSTGGISANTTGFTDGRIKLYTVVTSGGAVTNYTDYRTNDASGIAYPRRSNPAYAASLTIDCRKGSLWDVGTLTGNIAITFSNAYEGQEIVVRTKQDATGSRTVTFSNATYGTDLTSGGTAATTTANKSDEWKFRYHAGSTQYRLVQCARGF